MKTNTEDLGTKSIGKLIAQYSIPAIIAMLVNAIYNVVDRIFIGQYVGEGALAGLTVAFPAMLLIFAFASMIGAGGASLMAIKLGENDKRGASHVFGNSLGLGLILYFVMLASIYTNLESILNLFGAGTDTLSYATDYMKIILFGFIFQMFSFILNSTVRTEGNPILPMAAMLLSAVANMILDYIFISRLGWGVEGAAYATIIGQGTGIILLLTFYIRGKSNLQIRLKDFIPEPKITGQIFSIGFATFIGTVGNSVAMTFLNRALAKYGGTPAITSMGAINSLFTFFIMPIMGIQQGLQPIFGFNYGAKKEQRVYATLRLGIIISVIFSTLVFILLRFNSTELLGMFIDSASSTIEIAKQGTEIYFLMLPVISVNLIGVAYFQSTARAKTSLILSMLRQFFLLIPLILILPPLFGLNGVWYVSPISDGLSVLFTFIVLLVDYKKRHEEIPKYNAERVAG